jgi:hypothetical protein
MRLERNTGEPGSPGYYEKEVTGWKKRRHAGQPPHAGGLSMRFANFGNGKRRPSDFTVYLHWSDVAEAIRQFAELHHPEALRLHKALNLATAIDEHLKPPHSS